MQKRGAQAQVGVDGDLGESEEGDEKEGKARVATEKGEKGKSHSSRTWRRLLNDSCSEKGRKRNISFLCF